MQDMWREEEEEGHGPPGCGRARASAPGPRPVAFTPNASRALMKVLHAARIARLDLLQAVNTLARMVTRWDSICGTRLDGLMCCTHSSLEKVEVGGMGR